MDWPLALIIVAAILGTSIIVVALIFTNFIKKMDSEE